jgi:hypothetical protein
MDQWRDLFFFGSKGLDLDFRKDLHPWTNGRIYFFGSKGLDLDFGKIFNPWTNGGIWFFLWKRI